MGKLSLAAALLAMAFGIMEPRPAAAVQLSSDGKGSAVIFPLISAEKGFETLLKLRNTSDDAVVTRAVLRSGVDGAAVLALRVVLGPRDSWTGLVTRLPDEGVVVVVADDSCTAGSTRSIQPSFGTAAWSVANERAQGWLEVFEMGTLPGELAALARPGNCASELDLGRIELGPTGNRISGDSQLLSILEGISFSIAPTFLKDLGLPARAHPLTQDSPTLADAKPKARIGNVVTTWERGIDAVSAVLAVRAVESTFDNVPATGSTTDMLLTFPTRRFYLAPPTAPFLVNSDPLNHEEGQQLLLEAFDDQGHAVIPGAFKCSPAFDLLNAMVISQSQINLRFSRQALLSIADTEPASVVTPTCFGRRLLPIDDAASTGQFRLDLSAFSSVSPGGWTVPGLPALPVTVTAVRPGPFFDSSGETVLVNYGFSRSQQVERGKPLRPRAFPRTAEPGETR